MQSASLTNFTPYLTFTHSVLFLLFYSQLLFWWDLLVTLCFHDYSPSLSIVSFPLILASLGGIIKVIIWIGAFSHDLQLVQGRIYLSGSFLTFLYFYNWSSFLSWLIRVWFWWCLGWKSFPTTIKSKSPAIYEMFSNHPDWILVAIAILNHIGKSFMCMSLVC